MTTTKTRNKEKWFEPEVKDTGWDKDDDPGRRRYLMLKAHGGDNLSSARAMQALSNVTNDKKTRIEAARDARYFFHAHQRGRLHYPTSHVMPRLSRPMPRISPRSPRITPKTPRLR